MSNNGKRKWVIFVLLGMIVVCAVGTYLLHWSYQTGPKELDFDQGELVGEKDFIQAKAPELTLLFIGCGILGLVVLKILK